MAGANPEVYVQALELLRARTNPQELIRLGLPFTPVMIDTGLKNLIAALQGLRGAGPELTPIYRAILANMDLRRRFIAAIRSPEGVAPAPRKNRTYKKRKASRKESRKAARIL